MDENTPKQRLNRPREKQDSHTELCPGAIISGLLKFRWNSPCFPQLNSFLRIFELAAPKAATASLDGLSGSGAQIRTNLLDLACVSTRKRHLPFSLPRLQLLQAQHPLVRQFLKKRKSDLKKKITHNSVEKEDSENRKMLSNIRFPNPDEGSRGRVGAREGRVGTTPTPHIARQEGNLKQLPQIPKK